MARRFSGRTPFGRKYDSQKPPTLGGIASTKRQIFSDFDATVFFVVLFFRTPRGGVKRISPGLSRPSPCSHLWSTIWSKSLYKIWSLTCLPWVFKISLFKPKWCKVTPCLKHGIELFNDNNMQLIRIWLKSYYIRRTQKYTIFESNLAWNYSPH